MDKDPKSHFKGRNVANKTSGRPTKLTPEIQKKVCDAIVLGAYIETAAAYASVSKQVLYDWMKKGNKQKGGIYRQFLDAIEEAMSRSELRDLESIDKNASGRPAKHDENGNLIAPSLRPNWQAAAWRLERKYPKKWGRREQVHIADDKPEEENLNEVVAKALDNIKDDRFDD